MIKVEMFAHENINDGSIIFEFSDIMIKSVSNGDYVKMEDFKLIFDEIESIDTKSIKAGMWYSFVFKLNPAEDDSGFSYQWFELIDIKPVRIRKRRRNP